MSVSCPTVDALDNQELAQANRKIVREDQRLPTVTLKDGTRVQTGTVATLLYNIALYNDGVRGSVERELELAIPTLFKVGLFDLFPPVEWVDGRNPGRTLVGKLALAYADEAGRQQRRV